MESTHKTIQAYLASQGNDFTEAEEIIEQRSFKTKVSTSQIRLSTSNGNMKFRMVLPEIHPGPYHPVGGSNIPYLMYKNLESSAMIMHSISDHSLNLPSKNEVENYLKNLDTSIVKEEGLVCTEPVTVQINKARVTGLLFGNNPLLFLSLSPHGMEDIPNYMKKEIEQYAKNINYVRILIVDCHNAMGEEI
jgi:putative membrane protein